MRLLIASICRTVLFVCPLLATLELRSQELDSLPVPHQEQFLLHSAALDEDRTVWVYVPPSYHGSTDRLPVLYLLDGGKHFSYVRELVAYLSDFEQPYIPPMIVVGIPNIDRGRDFSPDKGAARFLQFMRNELIPYVESHYRTQPYRILEGHSLGGLFAVYAHAKAPTLFNAFILISPAINDNPEQMKILADFGQAVSKAKKVKAQFFITLGDESTNGVDLLKARFDTASQINYEYRQYKGENHFSVPYKSTYDGLRYIYPDWFLDVFLNKSEISWSQIEHHFSGLSEKYGYPVLPTEDFINNCGYAQLDAGHLEEAMGIFQANVQLHPDSWNAHDSVGEAYMRAGDKAKAIEYYRNSVRLNPKNENGRQNLKKLGAH